MDHILELEEAALAADKWILRYESFEEQQRFNIESAELACLANTGGLSKLENYFEAAKVDEAEQKRQNILKKMWTTLKELFQKITNTIFKRRPKMDRKAKYVISKKAKKALDILPTIWKKLKSLILSARIKLNNHPVLKEFLKVLTLIGSIKIIGRVLDKTIDKLEERQKAKREGEIDTAIAEAGTFLKAYDVLGDVSGTLKQMCEKGAKNPQAVDPSAGKEFKTITAQLEHAGSNLCKIMGLNNVSYDNMKDYANGIIKKGRNVPTSQSYPDPKTQYNRMARKINVDKLTDEQVIKFFNNNKENLPNQLVTALAASRMTNGRDSAIKLLRTSMKDKISRGEFGKNFFFNL